MHAAILFLGDAATFVALRRAFGRIIKRLKSINRPLGENDVSHVEMGPRLAASEARLSAAAGSPSPPAARVGPAIEQSERGRADG